MVYLPRLKILSLALFIFLALLFFWFPTKAAAQYPVNECDPPGSVCESGCVTLRCANGDPCASGTKYCRWDPGGNYCGGCEEEVNNCVEQCSGCVPFSQCDEPYNTLPNFCCVSGYEGPNNVCNWQVTPIYNSDCSTCGEISIAKYNVVGHDCSMDPENPSCCPGAAPTPTPPPACVPNVGDECGSYGCCSASNVESECYEVIDCSGNCVFGGIRNEGAYCGNGACVCNEDVFSCSADCGVPGGPTPTPTPPPPAGCNFGDCGVGCAGDERYVSGNCWSYPWFGGDGCYYDTNCVGPPPGPTPTPTTAPGAIPCNYSEVSLNVSPGTALIGQALNFTISGDASTWIGNSWNPSNSVTGCVFPSWDNITCTANQAGPATWTHTWQKCEGSIFNCSAECSESAPFTILPPPVTCSVTLSPPSQNFYIGEDSQITASVIMSNGSSPNGQVQQIDFTGYNASLITLTLDPQPFPPPYSTTVSAAGVNGGTTNVSATVTLVNGNTCPAAPVSVEVLTPTCTLTLAPNPMNLTYGDTGTLYATVNPTPAFTEINRVAFTSGNPSVVTVTSPDYSLAYTSDVTTVGVGSTTISALAYLGLTGAWSCPAPAPTSVVNVAPPPAWFQTGGGDVHAEGELNSSIPSSTTNPNPYLSLAVEGYPGVTSYGSTADFGFGSASQTPPFGWLVNSRFGGSGGPTDRYDYDFFLNRVSNLDTTTLNTAAPIQNTLTSLNTTNPNIFYLVAQNPGNPNGNLTIPQANIWNVGGSASDVTVVIFVPGDLTIRGRITIPANQNNFLAIIVQGDIIIEEDVYDPSSSNPAVEGVYVTNGQISTGTTGNPVSERQFAAQGVFVAWGGFDLQRDLEPAENLDTPAESFEYDINLLMAALKLKELMPSNFVWEEVAP